ncbi:MAG: CATRA system-associated protein [Candidatus Limnocylindrales bacterium]
MTFDEVAADALTTVRLVPRWELDPDAWAAVEACLDRLAAAIATRDQRALRRALTELEDHCPTRLSAIRREPGSVDQRGAPPTAILDIVNTLIHPAHGWGATGGSAASAPGSGRG